MLERLKETKRQGSTGGGSWGFTGRRGGGGFWAVEVVRVRGRSVAYNNSGNRRRDGAGQGKLDDGEPSQFPPPSTP